MVSIFATSTAYPLRLNYLHRRLTRPIRPLRILSMDVAKSELNIGIVGFGNYGQFIGKTLARQGHTVIAHSRSDYSHLAAELGVTFFSSSHDLCKEQPEVVLLCTSILSTKSVLKSLPLQHLNHDTLFVDLLSVKEFPRQLLLNHLPLEFDILCTHPMFGPDSGKHGWHDLPFMYDQVRIGQSEKRRKRCRDFIDAFRREGCKMVEMSCEEHDRHAASSQFVAHMVGRVLEKLKLQTTPINTKSYEKLLDLMDSTSNDSFELFYGLFLYNKNAIQQLERMELAFKLVKQQLISMDMGS